MKNTKKKIDVTKSPKKGTSHVEISPENDFADEVNWEAEIQRLQGRTFESLDEVLEDIANTVLQQTAQSVPQRDQIDFICALLRDNEEIRAFIESQVKIIKPLS